MKKIKLKIFNIDIIFCKNNKEYLKLMKTEKIKKMPPFESRGLTVRFDNEHDKMELIVIIVDETLNEFEFIDTMVHESSHAVSIIMEYFKIKDDEYRSYYLGHICKEIYKHIKKKKR